MDRRRCHLCRNPIRSTGVRWSADAGSRWFHTDCSRAAQQQQQADYRDAVRREGLDALLAPYARAAGSPAWDSEEGLRVVGA